MTTWNMQETRHLVLRHYGKCQFELACKSLGSAIDRLAYAEFHYQEAQTLIERGISNFQDNRRLFVAMLGGAADEQQSAYDTTIASIGAHIIACVQSLHAIGDIFAHAIYFSLALNLTPDAIRERDVSIYSVCCKLKGNPDYDSLGKGLETIVAHEDSAYLRALVNLSKHRSLVKPMLWVDMTGKSEDSFQFKFPSFVHNKAPYPEREMLPFLQSELKRISEIVIDTGAELNAVLRAQST